MSVPVRRRNTLRLLATTATLISLGSPSARAGERGEDESDSFRRGKIFMITNAIAGNQLQIYARSTTGPARLLSSLASGGTGTGSGLGSQGAVTISTNGRYVFVVNAGSNTVSTFKLSNEEASLVSTVSSGGARPISVAESDGVVYVLNAPASGTGNSVVGYRNDGGILKPLADGKRLLSDGSAPAQVGFDSDGGVLVVSLKASNQLLAYAVDREGRLSNPAEVTPSAGAVPFGFAITSRNVLVVSEAATSSASSYRVGEARKPLLQTVTAALSNGQGAACWIAVTPDGRYAFSANAATSNISTYGVDRAGRLSLLQPQAGFTSGNGALDMAVTPDGRQLHIFAPRAPQQIVSFAIGSDGSLTKIGSLNVTAGAGIAAN